MHGSKTLYLNYKQIITETTTSTAVVCPDTCKQTASLRCRLCAIIETTRHRCDVVCAQKSRPGDIAAMSLVRKKQRQHMHCTISLVQVQNLPFYFFLLCCTAVQTYIFIHAATWIVHKAWNFGMQAENVIGHAVVRARQKVCLKLYIFLPRLQ